MGVGLALERVGLALEEWVRQKQTDIYFEILSPLALQAGSEKKVLNFIPHLVHL